MGGIVHLLGWVLALTLAAFAVVAGNGSDGGASAASANSRMVLQSLNRVATVLQARASDGRLAQAGVDVAALPLEWRQGVALGNYLEGSGLPALAPALAASGGFSDNRTVATLTSCEQLEGLDADAQLCTEQGSRLYLLIRLAQQDSEKAPVHALTSLQGASGIEEVQVLDAAVAPELAAGSAQLAAEFGLPPDPSPVLLLVRTKVAPLS